MVSSSDTRAVARLLSHDRASDRALARRVAGIVARVRLEGDSALLRYARRFDGLRGAVEVTREEMVAGARQAPPDLRDALRVAARHIRTVARRQLPRGGVIQVASGVRVEQRVTPLDRVGCYVPGGRYPLPSSLLMTAVPARVAGVRDVIVVCPRPEPSVLAAALEAGATRLPRVDRIVGPGNAYVAAAKALVSPDCAIDFHAGPSEIVVVASSGRAEWIAADLIAQAEHDPDARALLVTPSARLARRVADAVARRLPAEGPARRALERAGGIIVTTNRAEAIELANRIAPEHAVCGDEEIASRITCAGAVFVGPYAAQAAGDYATGSNHVLPTAGAARARGGLSAADFVRVSSVQRITQAGLRRLAPAIIRLAEAEGLRAHADSIRVRLSS